MSGRERSTLIIGPSRSGKTSSLIIPNLLSTSRATIVTSTKDDVVREMADSTRAHETLLFDPSGTVPTPRGVRRVGYSPLRAAGQWDQAVVVTRTLVDSTHGRHLEGSATHWAERAGALVAPLLHASSLMNESLSSAITRVESRVAQDAVEFLSERYGDLHPSVSLLRGVLQTESRELSGIWSSAAGIFSGLRSEAARESARDGLVDLDAFVHSQHQIHIVSPSHVQHVSAPLVAGFIDEIVQHTYRRHHEGARLLLALDELANVAPLPRLASIISEGGGQGVVTLACLQDLSQARARWGESAEGFLSLFPTTVVLPGVADMKTLDALHHLAGRELVASPSHQLTPRGRSRGRGQQWIERDRMSIADVARGRSGFALGLSPTKEPRWIQLTPAYRDPRWSSSLSRSRSLPPRSLSPMERDSPERSRS
ncbi:MAG: TraM recognition domain-containing protein [Acidimicrobiaceae bacterium]|nr:TraM recognition domain-containing protein [Acidimicrobiaceae bacterium]